MSYYIAYTRLLIPILDHNPSVTAAAVAAVVYAVIGIALFISLRKKRDWCGLCLPIGSICLSSSSTVREVVSYAYYTVEALGFVFLVLLAHHLNSILLFILMRTFIVCTPSLHHVVNFLWKLLQVADAFVFIHDQHVVHRELKQVCNTVVVVSCLCDSPPACRKTSSLMETAEYALHKA